MAFLNILNNYQVAGVYRFWKESVHINRHDNLGKIIKTTLFRKHPSVSRDHSKTSLLGVDTQRSYLSQGMCQDEKKEKVKSRSIRILLKDKFEKLLRIILNYSDV